MNKDEQEARIAQFWSWFVQHESDLARVSPDANPALDGLLQSLQRISPKLYFEVCANSNPHELIVTAEGRQELFPLVDAVVAVAPRIAGWSFIALKPPTGFGFQTSYEEAMFDPRSMWFLPLESPSNPTFLGLRVGIPGFAAVQEQISKSAILVVLDTALGERSAASDIQHVEVTALPPRPEDQGFIELVDLAGYIEWRKGKLAEQGRSPSAPSR